MLYSETLYCRLEMSASASAHSDSLDVASTEASEHTISLREETPSESVLEAVTDSDCDTSVGTQGRPTRSFQHLRARAKCFGPKEAGSLLQGHDTQGAPMADGSSAEVCIALTLYKENGSNFKNTMHAIRQNIEHIKSRDGRNEPRREVVVCVIADGLHEIDYEILDELNETYCCDTDHCDTHSYDAHIFEPEHKQGCECELRVVLCLKSRNRGKLDSHGWFFEELCPMLKPRVCFMIDVGTLPQRSAIHELLKHFDDNLVGGACGEIYPEYGSWKNIVLNPLVAAQIFEYKVSNILDKAFESIFGYVTVLPGAFSAYRYEALRYPDSKSTKGAKDPLEIYLHGKDSGGSILTRNMYLAEDRILGFEVLMRRDKPYILKYVEQAKAATDIPDSLPKLVAQRRRWLNGSLSASLYFIWSSPRIWLSGHTFLRKFALQFQFIYFTVQFVLTFTGLANFYLTSACIIVAATSNSESDPFVHLPVQDAGAVIQRITLFGHIATLVAILIIACYGVPPQRLIARTVYTLAMCFFAFYILVVWYCSIFTLVIVARNHADYWEYANHLMSTNITFCFVILNIVASIALTILASILHWDVKYLVQTGLYYELLNPTYINLLLMHAICNLHDVSWNAKDTECPAQATGQDKKDNKTDHADQINRDKEHSLGVVLVWVSVNGILAAIFHPSPTGYNTYVAAIVWISIAMSLLRFCGSIIYLDLDWYWRLTAHDIDGGVGPKPSVQHRVRRDRNAGVQAEQTPGTPPTIPPAAITRHE